MCRWLVYRGDSILLADLLVKPVNSLIGQALVGSYTPGVNLSPLYTEELNKKRNEEVNGDGFGIAWYPKDKKQSVLFKSLQPAWNDRNLQELCAVIETSLMFGHIRAASPGTAVHRENCHPFKFGPFTFMHNGGINEFSKIKRTLREQLRNELYNMIEGTTDSEHVFALYLNNLVPTSNDYDKVYSSDEMVKAMEKTLDQILKIQKKCGVEKTENSLNLAVTNGKILVATRFRSNHKEDPPSLYWAFGSDFALKDGVFRMGRDSPKDTALLCSEPLTYEVNDWHLVPKDHFVVFEPSLTHPEKVKEVKVFPINVQYS